MCGSGKGPFRQAQELGEERIVYDKVQDMIYKNPIGFDDETHNYKDLFPLRQSKLVLWCGDSDNYTPYLRMEWN